MQVEYHSREIVRQIGARAPLVVHQVDPNHAMAFSTQQAILGAEAAIGKASTSSST